MEDESTARFRALWAAQHLETIEGVMALDATVTARTAALGATSRVSRVSSVDVPPLPTISLDDPNTAEGAAPSHGSADLVVLDTLGEGGMGLVYRARQRSLAREVAVKVLRRNAVVAEEGNDLLREALITGGIEHPNIVPVHALGVDSQGHPVLVMKRIEGTNWRTLLYDDAHPGWGPLLAAHGDALTAHLEVLQRVAEAAHFAHTRGVVHRDIKPENVMVGAFGEVYLVDWGVAVRVGQSSAPEGLSAIRGTPAYMAPEMVEGDVARIDARTDVYLLGATLHELLTRTVRHAEPNLHATLFAAFRSRPVAYGPEVADELAVLCNESTQADPSLRPASAQVFRRRVADHLKHRASLTLCDTAQSRLDALRAALAAGDADDATVRRLATEGRYGFAQALVVWADNGRAREGLEQVIGLLLGHEIARENIDAARALAAELKAPDASLPARMEALAEVLRLRKAREAMVLQEVYEADLSQGVRARLPMIVALLFITTSAHILLSMRPQAQITLKRLTLQHTVVSVVIGVAMAVWRRRLIVNRITRQFQGMVLVYIGSTLAHRALVLASGVPVPLPSVVLSDLMILTAASLAAAVGLRPWFLGPALCTMAGVGLTLLDPSRALRWFTLSANGMFLCAIYFSWIRVRRPASLGDSGITNLRGE